MVEGEYSRRLATAGIFDFRSRRLAVYPVLVYTDRNYGAAGISLYLQEQFKERISPELSGSFRHIYPLAFCSLDYLLENVDILSTSRNHPSKVISYYSKQLKNRRKKAEKTGDLNDMLELNIPFERISYEFIGTPSKRDGFVEKIVRIFELI
jgi:hypothetical protein